MQETSAHVPQNKVKALTLEQQIHKDLRKKYAKDLASLCLFLCGGFLLVGLFLSVGNLTLYLADTGELGFYSETFIEFAKRGMAGAFSILVFILVLAIPLFLVYSSYKDDYDEELKRRQEKASNQ